MGRNRIYKIAFSLLPVLLCSLSSCGINYDEVSYEQAPLAKYKVHNLDEDTMPISAWAGPDSSLGLNTAEQFEIVKEAGLNMVYGGLGDRIWSKDDATYQTKLSNIRLSLQYAADNDLLFFPVDYAFQGLEGEELSSYLTDVNYESYESFAGILCCDEPRYGYFKTLSSIKEKFYSHYEDDYTFYVNMNPSYVDESYLGGRSYYSYLEDYVTTTGAKFFSYDHYPELGDFPSIRFDYFLNLAYASRVSRKCNVPFWNFILSSSHKLNNNTYYRLPSEGELYWQASTSLAYGCKGFQYFCYMTPNVTGFLGEPGSIVNEYGEKSSIFPYIQNINKAIASMDEVLINSTLIGLLSDGDSPVKVYSPFVNKDCNNRDISSFSASQGGIVSTFSYGKKTAYLFVNNNFSQTSHLMTGFSRGIIGELMDFDGNKTDFKGNRLSLDIKPGQCVLMRVTN